MAYQLLKQVLPVDIVNIIVEYTIYYNTHELHLHKICNNKNIRFSISTIKEIRKRGCAQTYNMQNFTNYEKLCKIVKIVPKDIDKNEINIKEYIKKNTNVCFECKQYQYFIYYCHNCDFSNCKDNEIFKV